jgi:hypothetical protein
MGAEMQFVRLIFAQIQYNIAKGVFHNVVGEVCKVVE